MRFYSYNKYVLVLLAGLFSAEAFAKAPTLQKMAYVGNNLVVIHGKDFGEPCRTCEVIGRYSDTLSYALPIKEWSDSRITIELPDLNQPSDKVQVVVKRKTHVSNRKAITLKRKLRLLSKETRAHKLSVGDKGEDRFPIKTGKPGCGKAAGVFDHAKLKIKKHRFADAVIVSSPSSGCSNCSPIVVRWYNEPTGSISYELAQYHRWVEGICKTRLRD